MLTQPMLPCFSYLVSHSHLSFVQSEVTHLVVGRMYQCLLGSLLLDRKQIWHLESPSEGGAAEEQGMFGVHPRAESCPVMQCDGLCSLP